MPVLTFEAGGERFAVALEQVAEIVGAPVVTPLPLLEAPAAGVMNLRGDALPAFVANAHSALRTQHSALIAIVITAPRIAILADAIGAMLDDGDGITAVDPQELVR